MKKIIRVGNIVYAFLLQNLHIAVANCGDDNSTTRTSFVLCVNGHILHCFNRIAVVALVDDGQ